MKITHSELASLARLLYHADHRKIDPFSRQIAERFVSRQAKGHGFSDWLDAAYNAEHSDQFPLEWEKRASANSRQDENQN